MSREEKRTTNSRMAHRDTRLLTEMLNNLAKEELQDSNKIRINTLNDFEDFFTRNNTVTNNMSYKRQGKLKVQEEV
jgi:hypothetical protein